MRDPLKDAYDRGFSRAQEIVQELKEAIEELPNLHPENSLAHHVDMVHRDRLRTILEETSEAT